MNVLAPRCSRNKPRIHIPSDGLDNKKATLYHQTVSNKRNFRFHRRPEHPDGLLAAIGTTTFYRDASRLYHHIVSGFPLLHCMHIFGNPGEDAMCSLVWWQTTHSDSKISAI